MAGVLVSYTRRSNLMYIYIWNGFKTIEGLTKDCLNPEYKIDKEQPNL